MKTKVTGSAISLLAILLVYGFINLILAGGQELWHHADNTKLNKIKTELMQEKRNIKGHESSLQTLEQLVTDSENEIKAYESNQDGVPEDKVEEYARKKVEYEGLLKEYQNSYDDYLKKINNYNLKVKKANKLADKIGSTWYVVPIPGKSH